MKDHCQRIKEIAANPTAKISDMTVKEMLSLKAHVPECWQCDTITELIAKNNPKDKWEPNWDIN